MKMYHGTSMERWKKIQKVGLVPRGMNGQSNWTHSIESNPDTIYFSTAYAMNFALASVNTQKLKKDHAVIIELDSDTLDPANLVPDEDALEQVSRRMGKGKDGLPAEWDMITRTRYYRGQTREFAEEGLDFYWSMDELGTAGHVGIVEPKHFTRVAVVDIKEADEIAWAYIDSQVSIANYKYLGARYRALNALIFNDPIDFGPENIIGDFPLPVRPKKGIHILDFNRRKVA